MPTIDPNIAARRQISDAAALQKPLPIQEGFGAMAAGVYTVTAADDTAGEATIPTGLDLAASIMGLTILDSGVYVPLTDLAISLEDGNIVLADGAATDDVTADWEVHWAVRGK